MVIEQKFETTKEYLNQIQRLDRMIENKLSEKYALKTMVLKVSASTEGERVQTSGEKDRLGDSVAKIVDLEREIDMLIDTLIDKKAYISGQIESLELDYYNVLTKRYVNYDTFDSIAQKTGWSIRKVFSVHGRALQEFEKRFGKYYLEKLQ